MSCRMLLASSLVTLALFGASDADRAFERLGARYLDEFPALGPVGSTTLGDHRFDHLLDEVSPEARARQAEFLRTYIRAVEAIPPGELGRANRIDRALLLRALRSSLWELEEAREWSWNPLVYTGLAGGAVYGLLARDFAPLPARLARVADRLAQFPRLFEQIRATLDVPRVPKIHAETAATQNKGILSMFDEMVLPHLAALEPAERRRLEDALAAARAAVEEHQKWIETELVPKAAGEFRIGPVLFDKKLAMTLDTPLTRAQVRERAEAEYRRCRADMYALARTVYAKEYPYTSFPETPSEEYRQALIRAALEVAYRDTPAANALVATAKASLALATDFVRAKNIVSLPPDPIEIIEMPEFQRGVSLAYCDSPGALEVGQKTFYAVSPVGADWPPEKVRSLLREYNLRSLHNLTIHEAMPGHYVQLAHSNRYPGKLRALLSSGCFIEGWAVYTEEVMMQEGFLDRDPLMGLMILKWRLRAIVNAIIDQAIHAEHMVREEAMRLMVEGAFQEEQEASAKWVRAQLTAVQLSTYFVGYVEQRELRQEVQKAWGKSFSLAKYHDKLLSFGSPPVIYARALLLDLPLPEAAQ